MSRLNRGSLHHTLLIYAVSEPGEWTAADIADDLVDTTVAGVTAAVQDLVGAGFLFRNSTDARLYPSRRGKDAISLAG